jgi:hypothetical protein
MALVALGLVDYRKKYAKNNNTDDDHNNDFVIVERES